MAIPLQRYRFLATLGCNLEGASTKTLAGRLLKERLWKAY